MTNGIEQDRTLHFRPNIHILALQYLRYSCIYIVKVICINKLGFPTNILIHLHREWLISTRLHNEFTIHKVFTIKKYIGTWIIYRMP